MLNGSCEKGRSRATDGNRESRQPDGTGRAGRSCDSGYKGGDGLCVNYKIMRGKTIHRFV